MTRKRKATLDDVVRELKQAQHCAAVLVVQVARLQSSKRAFLIDALRPIGLRARQIAKVLGTTEATVNVTRWRQRPPAPIPPAPTEPGKAQGTMTREEMPDTPDTPDRGDR